MGADIYARHLRKTDLGGVIFGCTNGTIQECLHKQLFGLPAAHYSYVKNIDPGLPLFLFNFSNRKLYGIFEAASPGQMNIDPYGWTTEGSCRTSYPAQVQIRVRLDCEPLREDQFRHILADNYYNESYIWFELNHAQASQLASTLAVTPSTILPQNTAKWRRISLVSPSPVTRDGHEGFKLPTFEEQLAFNHGYLGSPSMDYVEDGSVVSDMDVEQMASEDKEESSTLSSDFQYIIAQLAGEIRDLKDVKTEQVQKIRYLEQSLVETDREIRELKDHCLMLDVSSSPAVARDDKTIQELKDRSVMLEVSSSPSMVHGDKTIHLLKDHCVILEASSSPPVAYDEETDHRVMLEASSSDKRTKLESF